MAVYVKSVFFHKQLLPLKNLREIEKKQPFFLCLLVLDLPIICILFSWFY